MKDRVPRYIEKAMLRLLEEPDLIRRVYRLLPYAAYEVGIRLVNSDIVAKNEHIKATRIRDQKKHQNPPKP